MSEVIGIIGALDYEIDVLKSAMVDCKEVDFAKRHFYIGKISGKEVVLVKCGVGKVNSAITAQMMIDRFNITCIINTGVAGSLNAKIDIGDIVIAEDAVYHDVENIAFGFDRGQVPYEDVMFFPMSKKLADTAEEISKRINPDIKVFRGRIASGDQFIADKKTKDNIVEWFNPLCVEEEGCPMAHTAYENDIPCLIIRAISDKADDSAEEDFPTFAQKAAKHSAKLLLEMIEKI